MTPIDQLLTPIAVALGPDWRAEVEADVTWGAYLARTDGLRLWCRIDAGRLHLSPEPVPMLTDTGHTTTYHYDRPVITVDPSRPAARLAADIRRRLLADAERWWTTATTVAAKSRRDWEAFQARRLELLALPGANSSHDAAWIYGINWRCDARYGNSVHLEFTSIAYADALAAVRAVEAARCPAPEVKS